MKLKLCDRSYLLITYTNPSIFLKQWACCKLNSLCAKHGSIEYGSIAYYRSYVGFCFHQENADLLVCTEFGGFNEWKFGGYLDTKSSDNFMILIIGNHL